LHFDNEGTIKLNFNELPDNVHQIFICINVVSPGTFEDMHEVCCRILDTDSGGQELAKYVITQMFHGGGLVLARLYKRMSSQKSWTVQFLGKFSGGTFGDSCADDMRALHHLPTEEVVLPRIKSSAEMTALASSLKEVVVALGWDVTSAGSVDLDVSAVVFDAGGKEQLDAVYFGKTAAPGLQHSGDNLTGMGGPAARCVCGEPFTADSKFCRICGVPRKNDDKNGDDETISVTFDGLASAAQQIYFCVNISGPPHVTFKDLSEAYCRIEDPSGSTLAEYKLSDLDDGNGLIMARLLKYDGRWCFQKIGKFSPGGHWRDLLPTMLQLRATLPRVLPECVTSSGAKRRRTSAPTPTCIEIL